MKMRFLALAAAAALLSVPAHAQPEVVSNQMRQADSIMAEQNFSPVDEIVRGTLAQGADAEFEVDLERGSDYIMVGFCDNGCTDLDLVLSDGDGDEVSSDLELDDKPVVAVEGTSGGTYVLEVKMATCGRDECHYGFRVFRRR